MTNIISAETTSNLQFPAGDGGANRFSDLAIALVKFCVQDGDDASREISERLAAMQTCVSEAKALLVSSDNSVSMNELSEKLDTMSDEIMNTVMSLQFFDRISQRMEHAIESVEAVSEPASEKAKTIEQRFTMDDERILYDALLEGSSVDEALDRANQKLNDTIESHGSDIELF